MCVAEELPRFQLQQRPVSSPRPASSRLAAAVSLVPGCSTAPCLTIFKRLSIRVAFLGHSVAEVFYRLEICSYMLRMLFKDLFVETEWYSCHVTLTRDLHNRSAYAEDPDHRVADSPPLFWVVPYVDNNQHVRIG